MLWAGMANTIPDGWAACDGGLVSKTVYPDLFQLLGYYHGGSGDVFCVPSRSNPTFTRAHTPL